MALAPADFPLQSVLKVSPTDVDQQSGRTGINSTAQDHITHVLGHMDPEAQDHTHQETFRECGGGGGEKGIDNEGKAVSIN